MADDRSSFSLGEVLDGKLHVNPSRCGEQYEYSTTAHASYQVS